MKILSVGFNNCMSKKNKKKCAYLGTYDGFLGGRNLPQKSSIFQVRVLQFLQFKNLNKLDIIKILLMYDIVISKRIDTLFIEARLYKSYEDRV